MHVDRVPHVSNAGLVTYTSLCLDLQLLLELCFNHILKFYSICSKLSDSFR